MVTPPGVPGARPLGPPKPVILLGLGSVGRSLLRQVLEQRSLHREE